MNNLSDLEIKELTASANALTEEQKRLALREFPDNMLWEELRRRYDISIKLRDNMKELVNN